jgi:hypothetical protein
MHMDTEMDNKRSNVRWIHYPDIANGNCPLYPNEGNDQKVRVVHLISMRTP